MADWPSEVRTRLGGLGLSPEREAEVVDELAQHLAEREGELRRAGSSPDEARRLALDDIGPGDDRLRAELARLRQARSAPPAPAGMPARRLVASIAQDLRYGARVLWQRPGFTIAAVLALAIGTGATAAIYGAVDTVLLRPMPFPHADRLYVPISVNRARHIDQGNVSFADYVDWRQQTDVFANVAILRPTNLDITGDGGDPERVELAQVSEDFFPLVDVIPVVGRTLVAADHADGAGLVTVISYGLWQDRFGRAGDILDRTLRIAGQPARIVGVLPPRGVWPDTTQVFVPMKPSSYSTDTRTRRDNLGFDGLARLRDGVTPGMAQGRLAAMAARLEHDNPVIRKGWTNTVIPLRDYIVDANLRAALYVLFGAAGAVLLIACANVANLSLVRGSSRARELAVRLSLGASRRRLVQQLVLEGVVLAAAGAAVGSGLAVLILKGLALIAPDGTPFLDQMHMNGRVLAANVCIGGVAALLSSVVPAWSNSALRLGAALRDGTTGSGASRGASRLRHGLVIAEIAAAVVLLTGAALLIRSFNRLSHVDPGVDLAHVLSARISIPTARYASDAARVSFVQALVARLDADPAIDRAALTSYVPAGGGGFELGRVFLAEGRPAPPAGTDVPAWWNVVTPDYFSTVGIRVREGRAFSDHDSATTTPVIVVSSSFGRAMFPGESPIGRRVRSWRDENVLREIVGVVDDVKVEGLADRERPLVYVPHTQNSWGGLLLVARARRGDPAALAAPVRKAVGALDPTLALSDVRSLADSARRSIADRRYATLLLGILAAVALGLSALGIYSVTSHVFALRRREMGIRLALGASRGHLYGLVLRHGLVLVVVGLAIGVAGAALATHLVASLLFETQATDASAWASMVGAVAVAATLACLIPARRAAAADPTAALRAD
jgi:putative ABC transport system permease protein